jgi:hypothetical protein
LTGIEGRRDNEQINLWQPDHLTTAIRCKIDADPDLTPDLTKETDLSDTDPAVAAGDSAFIEFVAACEKLVQATGDPIETRDAVAVLTKDLASRWTISDPNFRQLQPGRRTPPINSTSMRPKTCQL